MKRAFPRIPSRWTDPPPEREPGRRVRRALRGAGCLLLLAVLAGCGLGTRFIFNSTRDTRETPAAAGLRFREVWFPSIDGVRLHGWFVPGDPGEPVVLFCHGNAANISYRVENLAFLHDLGVSTFIFDYRGYGASDGEPLHERDLYTDGRGALAWLRTQGWTDRDTVVFGRSLGSAVALEVAVEAAPAAVVLECPFTSLHDLAWKMAPWTYALFGWWGLRATFDNLGKIADLDAPLLLIHGSDDRVIPVDMSRRLFAEARPPKDLLVVPGAGHSNSFQVDPAAYREAWRELLQRAQARRAVPREARPSAPEAEALRRPPPPPRG